VWRGNGAGGSTILNSRLALRGVAAKESAPLE
jgi:hypothetical protein